MLTDFEANFCFAYAKVISKIRNLEHGCYEGGGNNNVSSSLLIAILRQVIALEARNINPICWLGEGEKY